MGDFLCFFMKLSGIVVRCLLWAAKKTDGKKRACLFLHWAFCTEKTNYCSEPELLVRCCHKICVNQIKSGQTADLHLTLLLHEIVWVNLRVFTEIVLWFLERFMQQCTIGPLKYSPNLFEIFTKFVQEKFYDHVSIIRD